MAAWGISTHITWGKPTVETAYDALSRLGEGVNLPLLLFYEKRLLDTCCRIKL
jgi:hypothetical protein